MTGLDPARHVIVEIATIVTDDELEIVAEGPDLVVHQPAEALAEMDDVVRRRCTPTAACSTRSRRRPSPSRRPATPRSRSSSEHVPEPRTVPLCGNSIGTDRRFLAAYLPEIEDYLHYRSVDVSTIKELARRWYPEVLAGQATQGQRPPRPRRHPREHRRAALLPGAPLRPAAGVGPTGTDAATPAAAAAPDAGSARHLTAKESTLQVGSSPVAP